MRTPRSFNTKLEVLNTAKDRRGMKRATKKISRRVLSAKGES